MTGTAAKPTPPPGIASDWPCLRAVTGRILPGDDGPGALDVGADDYVTRQLWRESAFQVPLIAAGLSALDAAARRAHGAPFTDLGPDEQDRLLGAVAGDGWFEAVTALVAEGAFADPGNGGNAGALAWRMIGYDQRLPIDAANARAPDDVSLGATGAPHGDDYDVVVVGAGAAGGIVACVLAEAGKTVLLLERGHGADGHRDHLRNHRLTRYGHNTGPPLEGHPRAFRAPDGCERIVQPHAFDYHNNASCVGGGTLVYGALAWRFHPGDFRMASRYGVPEGSSLTDWPIGYDDLARWYERAEWEIGVAGDGAARGMPGRRDRAYPMPPVQGGNATEVLRRGASQLGIDAFAPPLAINTVPRAGRPACVGCASCVGFPCPVDAKNGTQNTAIPRALATGRCTLVTGAMAARIVTDPRGRATGLDYFTTDETGQTVARYATARAVVVSCGAIESARLLLNSATATDPEGLGNNRDLVGRNLQGHLYPTAFGLFDEEVEDCVGPGPSVATCAYNHGNPGVIGGAMLANDFVMTPIGFWTNALPPDLPRWGAPAKTFMREAYRHVLQVRGPVHEIPDPTCRVALARDVRDRHGLPVAHLSGVVHDETMRSVDFIAGKARAWVEASGARRAWTMTPSRRLSAYQHQAGTCRMGTDPAHGVTDRYGRVWGHDNLFVCDASLHPTNGGFNPVLTIMALAFRNAAHVAGSL